MSKSSLAITENNVNEDSCSILSNDNDDDYNDDFEDDSDFEDSKLSEFRQRVKSVPNKTFTSKQVREIERDNAILMDKILYYNRKPSTPKFAKNLPRTCHKVTSAEINRKKAQVKINWENQILLRKIQTVKPSIKFSKN